MLFFYRLGLKFTINDTKTDNVSDVSILNMTFLLAYTVFTIKLYTTYFTPLTC